MGWLSKLRKVARYLPVGYRVVEQVFHGDDSAALRVLREYEMDQRADRDARLEELRRRQGR